MLKKMSSIGLALAVEQYLADGIIFFGGWEGHFVYDFIWYEVDKCTVLRIQDRKLQNLTSLDSQAVSTASETVFRPQGPIILFFLNLYIHVYNV